MLSIGSLEINREKTMHEIYNHHTCACTFYLAVQKNLSEDLLGMPIEGLRLYCCTYNKVVTASGYAYPKRDTTHFTRIGINVNINHPSSETGRISSHTSLYPVFPTRVKYQHFKIFNCKSLSLYMYYV